MEGQLDRFTLVKLVGSGIEGNVWEARDKRLGDRRVAIKIVDLTGKSDAQIREVLERFDQGAGIAARLDHRNVVQVFDKGIDPSRKNAFLVMQFVDGETLKDVLKRSGKLPLPQVVSIMVRTLDALDYCHKAGVVHRDIKPSNLMLSTDGEIKVTDFGIAHAENSDLTNPNLMMGTPSYMSPEQFTGSSATDARSDIWSCGVVLYEMLTGRRPFEGDSWQILAQKIETEQPVPPSRYTPSIPAALDKVVLRALESQPRRRFESAAAFADALRQAVPVDIEAQPRRHRSWLRLLGTSAAAAVLVLAALFWPVSPTPSPDPAPAVPEQIAALPCSTVRAIVSNGAGHYLLHGIIGDGRPLAALEAIIGRMPPGSVQRDYTTFPNADTACRLAELVRKVSSESPETDFHLSLAGGKTVLRDGEEFKATARMPDFGGEFWLDYFGNDGNVDHFEISKGAASHYRAHDDVATKLDPAGKSIYTVGGPSYGTDIAVAFAVGEPPPGWVVATTQEKPEPEAADFYLQQLTAALDELYRRHVRVAADAVVLQTLPP